MAISRQQSRSAAEHGFERVVPARGGLPVLNDR
jgi:hypothetical protein